MLSTDRCNQGGRAEQPPQIRHVLSNRALHRSDPTTRLLDRGKTRLCLGCLIVAVLPEAFACSDLRGGP
ncbi:hypothetical protein CKO40_20405 [Halochromatium glycolicum]|uniref:Uncharacterized protein n=1 Tax=Halochromatium glycolicum TaxID=85075 RepID=A0AAJ0XBJ4_9GAMM|nr:hypothetical protein [Halochromatium glycolicum]